MTAVWIGDAAGAAEGDYVLRPADDLVEVGRVEDGRVCWLRSVPASAVPDLDGGDRERLLTAVRGLETALDSRGG